jgi:hypothetical protein
MHTPRGIQGVVRVTYQDGLTQSWIKEVPESPIRRDGLTQSCIKEVLESPIKKDGLTYQEGWLT